MAIRKYRSSASLRSALAQAAIGRGHHAHVHLYSPVRPTGRSPCSLQNTQQFYLDLFRCLSDLIRKMVPPEAAQNSPGASAYAPVNAPLRTPNSSLSANSRGSAPQFTATKACGRAGWPRESPARASLCPFRSLPAPISELQVRPPGGHVREQRFHQRGKADDVERWVALEVLFQLRDPFPETRPPPSAAQSSSARLRSRTVWSRNPRLRA